MLNEFFQWFQDYQLINIIYTFYTFWIIWLIAWHIGGVDRYLSTPFLHLLGLYLHLFGLFWLTMLVFRAVFGGKKACRSTKTFKKVYFFTAVFGGEKVCRDTCNSPHNVGVVAVFGGEKVCRDTSERQKCCIFCWKKTLISENITPKSEYFACKRPQKRSKRCR